MFNQRNAPVFIVSERPTIYFFTNLIQLCNRIDLIDTKIWLKDGINQYIEQFAVNSQYQSILNWFVRHEIQFVLGILRSTAAVSNANKTLQLKLAYKLLVCLTEHQINDILYVFSQFIFNVKMYDNSMDLTADDMNRMKSAYGKVYVEYYFNANAERDQKKKMIENYDRVPMLAEDWPGVLLLKMYTSPDAFFGEYGHF